VFFFYNYYFSDVQVIGLQRLTALQTLLYGRYIVPFRVVFVRGMGGHVLVTGTPYDDPPLQFSFVSQVGMVKIPLTAVVGYW